MKREPSTDNEDDNDGDDEDKPEVKRESSADDEENPEVHREPSPDNDMIRVFIRYDSKYSSLSDNDNPKVHPRYAGDLRYLAEPPEHAIDAMLGALNLRGKGKVDQILLYPVILRTQPGRQILILKDKTPRVSASLWELPFAWNPLQNRQHADTNFGTVLKSDIKHKLGLDLRIEAPLATAVLYCQNYGNGEWFRAVGLYYLAVVEGSQRSLKIHPTASKHCDGRWISPKQMAVDV